MRAIWTLARRELRGFFDHPTAYILAIAFLALSLYLTFENLYAVELADLRPFFNLLPWLFTVFIPAVTMRSLAEERGRGTLEWLVVQPLNEFQLVAGKFLGNWLFILITLAGTLPTAIGVMIFSDADPGILFAQYLGAAFFSAQLTAISMVASAATKNQITAFITAASFSFALILIGLPFVLLSIPPWASDLLGQLAVLPHVEGVSRGVIDVRDFLYFVTTCALFLALAYFLIVRERLSPTRGAYRRLRGGILAAVVGVVLLNLVGSRIHGRIDLTAERLYTLSDGTREMLQTLDDVVTLKLFVSRDLPPQVALTLRDTRDLVADYNRISGGLVRVEEFDPSEDADAQQEATALGVQQFQFQGRRENEFVASLGWLGLAIVYANDQDVIPFVDSAEDLEYRLTSSISSMTTPLKPTAAFLTGFGAKEPENILGVSQLLGDRYEITTIDISSDSLDVELHPLSQNVIVLAGPQVPIPDAAVAMIEEYLDAGGAGLFFLDRTTPDIQQSFFTTPRPTGLEAMLERKGVVLTDQVIFDVQANQVLQMNQGFLPIAIPYPVWPIVIPAEGDHPATRNLQGLVIGWANAIDITDPTRVTPLWQTTLQGGRLPAVTSINPQTMPTPPRSLFQTTVAAVAVRPDEPGAEGSEEGVPASEASGGRMIVVGDSDMLDNQYNFIGQNPENVIFLANAVDWLAQDEALIDIRSKDRTPSPLVFSSEGQQSLFRWGNLIGIPLLLIGIGAYRAAVRKGRSERRWQDVQQATEA